MELDLLEAKGSVDLYHEFKYDMLDKYVKDVNDAIVDSMKHKSKTNDDKFNGNEGDEYYRELINNMNVNNYNYYYHLRNDRFKHINQVINNIFTNNPVDDYSEIDEYVNNNIKHNFKYSDHENFKHHFKYNGHEHVNRNFKHNFTEILNDNFNDYFKHSFDNHFNDISKHSSTAWSSTATT